MKQATIDKAANEAAIFDRMIPGWHTVYAMPGSDLWNIILLRRNPDEVECLAREVCQRLLNDTLESLRGFHRPAPR